MKKKYWAALAAGTAAGLWCVRRDRKYPVCRELRFVNKLVVPGCAVSLKTVKMANRVLSRLPLPEPPGDVERRRVQISSEDGAPVPLTVYRPKDLGRDAPCLVYFHGGGFCMGDQGYIHRYAAQYAREAGCVVVFVHYRTADEAPFPRPFWDCYAALGWAWDRAPELGADRARFAVGGDSAGGALAAACALRARDEGNIRLCFQLLVYPVTDCRMETASMQRFTDTPMWNATASTTRAPPTPGRWRRRGWRCSWRMCGAPSTASTFFKTRPAPAAWWKKECRRCVGRSAVNRQT